MSWPTGTFTPAIPSVFSGKSSHIRQRKMGSDVWRHFEKYKDEDGKVRARCNLCKRDFDGSSRMGTTRLRNHYESCQRKKRGGGGDKSDEAASAIKEKAVMDQQLNHLDTTRMIIKRGIRSGDSINAADIMDVYNLEKEKLRKYFKKLRCRFYLTADEVRYGGDYSCLTVSFIDDDWKLKKKIISFKHIEAVHNFGEYLKNVLLEWGIDMTRCVMINMTHYVNSFIEREIWFSNEDFKVDYICGICWIAIDSIEDYLYNWMSKILNYVMETLSKNKNFQIAIERAKSLGKAVTAEVIPSKQDLKLKEKHWCNTGGLLKLALGFKEAFFVLENMDPDFKSINLTKKQWDQVRAIYECYEDLTDIAFLDHWSNYQTGNMYFPMICSLYTKSLLMTKNAVWKDAKNAIWEDELLCYWLVVIRTANKYWCEYKSVLAVAAVLDPRFKMDIVQHWYKKIYGDECEAQLTVFTDYFINVYNEYAKGANNFKSYTSGSQQTNSSISYEMLDFSGKLCKSSHDHNNVQSLNSELHLYLNKVKFPLIKDFNILEWWRDNTQYFPTLAEMARDFLSIQLPFGSREAWDEYMEFRMFGQSVGFEGLDSNMVSEAYVCTKSWLRSAEYE
ncbi:hypothetical protein ACOSQ2_006562 [Xanthoceras sorbifolium]